MALQCGLLRCSYFIINLFFFFVAYLLSQAIHAYLNEQFLTAPNACVMWRNDIWLEETDDNGNVTKATPVDVSFTMNSLNSLFKLQVFLSLPVFILVFSDSSHYTIVI